MLKLDIHTGDYSEHGECADCGSKTRTIWGYVYRHEEAHCAYYAYWTDRHVERGIRFLLSIGQWGDGTNGTMRSSVGIDCQFVDNVPQLTLIDAVELPWANEELLGKPLKVEEVEGQPIKDEAIAIVNQILADDPRVKEFIAGESPAIS